MERPVSSAGEKWNYFPLKQCAIAFAIHWPSKNFESDETSRTHQSPHSNRTSHARYYCMANMRIDCIPIISVMFINTAIQMETAFITERNFSVECWICIQSIIHILTKLQSSVLITVHQFL